MAELSVLESEAGEAPVLAAQQFAYCAQLLPDLVERLDRLSPTLVATIARGSSDNAVAFGSYLLGLRLGLPAASLPPSLASVYGRPLHLERAVALAVSQSGASPDLSAAVVWAKAGGAFAIGLVNDPDSVLARSVDVQIEMRAGSERAVAATKSFVLSLTALVHLVAAWTRDATLSSALGALPATLAQCRTADWTAAIQLLAQTQGAFVVGRGPTLPVAREFALKLKEVCGIHAEAMSAAELLHGPISIASPSMPAIAIAGDGSIRATLNAAVTRLRAAGAPVVLLTATPEDTADGIRVIVLPMAPDPLLQPVVAIQAAYPFFAELARLRGRDPDRPPQLEKITRTL